MRTEYSLGLTVWKQSALLLLLDQTHKGVFKGTSIHPFLWYRIIAWEISASFPETQQSYTSGCGKVLSGTWNGTEGSLCLCKGA